MAGAATRHRAKRRARAARTCARAKRQAGSQPLSPSHARPSPAYSIVQCQELDQPGPRDAHARSPRQPRDRGRIFAGLQRLCGHQCGGTTCLSLFAERRDGRATRIPSVCYGVHFS